MRIYELKCIDNRKSFYGKAHVIEHDNGVVELQSYDTIVCKIENGVFKKLWNGYSQTTMRHINSFIDWFGIEGGGKVWWDGLEAVV